MPFIIKDKPIQSITTHWPSGGESQLMVHHVGQRGVEQILTEKINDIGYFSILDEDGNLIEYVQQSFVVSVKYIPMVRTDG